MQASGRRFEKHQPPGMEVTGVQVGKGTSKQSLALQGLFFIYWLFCLQR